jgi:hypothetical protein
MVYLPLVWMGVGLIIAAAGVVFVFDGPALVIHRTAEFPAGPVYRG